MRGKPNEKGSKKVKMSIRALFLALSVLLLACPATSTRVRTTVHSSSSYSSYSSYSSSSSSSPQLLVGTAKQDITGPIAEVNFMGYAMPGQTGRGLHFRLFSRAFVYSDGLKKVAYVSIDTAMCTTAIKVTFKIIYISKYFTSTSNFV